MPESAGSTPRSGGEGIPSLLRIARTSVLRIPEHFDLAVEASLFLGGLDNFFDRWHRALADPVEVAVIREVDVDDELHTSSFGYGTFTVNAPSTGSPKRA